MEEFSGAYASIRTILEQARSKAYYAVNSEMVQAYWGIGKVIIEEEQNGTGRAEYGERLMMDLSQRLTQEYGSGFNKTNIFYMRQFFLSFPIFHAVRGKLTWTHYRLLLRQDNENARSFYLNECINARWSTRELERQMNSLLYERLALSRDKKGVMDLAQKGHIAKQPKDIIKDPVVLEVLGLGEKAKPDESQIEAALVDHLKEFLLEMGKGFSLVGRQQRISVGDEHYYVDLVFYNYLLKCFVLIDLKAGKLDHCDIGQMDFYVRYYEKEVRGASVNPTIGLILCSDRNSAMAKYTLLADSKSIFAAKYRTVLPAEKELSEELERQRHLLGVRENGPNGDRVKK